MVHSLRSTALSRAASWPATNCFIARSPTSRIDVLVRRVCDPFTQSFRAARERLSRYGLDGKLVDFGKQEEVSARELILEYLEFVDDVVDELDSREELNYVHEILKMGTGADRRLRVFEKTGDLKKVVDYIIEETEIGLTESQTPVSARKVG